MTVTRAAIPRLGASALMLVAGTLTVASCTTASGGTASSPPTYYVSPTGDDAAAGTSPGSAWRTLGQASSAVLRPGTRLLLQGGGRFTGQLTLDRADAGKPSEPVVIGSYGRGVPTIFALSGSGIFVHDTAGVEVHGVRIVGQSEPGGSGTGINLYSDLPADYRLDHVVIDDVDVSGFVNGIAVGGAHAGFSDVRVSNSKLYGNIDNGFISYGPEFDSRAPSYANQDVAISHVIASRNLGNPKDKKNDTGNGIVLGSVNGGTVTWSTASGNGGFGAASEGPAAIWTYDSTRVDIEHNLAYDNKTANRIDGNGFGLDQNTSDSVLQYNLSYGNDGTGYLVYSALSNGAQKNNVVRENISSGDVRDSNPFYAGITIIGQVKAAAVYQNTVIMISARTGTPPVLRLGSSLHGVSVLNNIFSSDSGPLVAVGAALPVSAVRLEGNDYYSMLGRWQLDWGQATYTSLDAWRVGTSEETMDGRATGLDADPELAKSVLDLHVRTATDASAGAGFALRAGSSLKGAGLNLVSVGIQPSATDFGGKPQLATHPDIGAQ